MTKDERIRLIVPGLLEHLEAPWFKGLMALYAEKAEVLAKGILHSEEDKPIDRGWFAALEWVLGRPQELIKEAEALEALEKAGSSKPKGE